MTTWTSSSNIYLGVWCLTEQKRDICDWRQKDGLLKNDIIDVASTAANFADSAEFAYLAASADFANFAEFAEFC